MDFDFFVSIGMWSPPHSGHQNLWQHGFGIAENGIILGGSAFSGLTLKCPLPFIVRQPMIASYLSDYEGRFRILPIRDFGSNQRWSQEVTRLVYSVAPLNSRVAIIGNANDPSSVYRRWFPEWSFVEYPLMAGMNSATIRKKWFESDSSLAKTTFINDFTRSELMRLENSTDYMRLKEDHWNCKRELEYWLDAPETPVFVVSRVLLTWNNRVLLVKPNLNGLLSLPGGRVNSRQTIVQSCLQQLEEQASVRLSEEQFRESLVDKEFFDSPWRADVGRYVVHSYHIDLPALGPEPQTSDKVSGNTIWVDQGELPSLYSQTSSDDFIVAERFLGDMEVL